ncbi:F0F1 ATP synthase subunit A [Microbulbifer marinus]|uniref:ATP synthase subunit a n=1 Tax=Microbulbifer marinus TaxID=658218 RepID=A0A1H3W1X9_9GAMM|nr:F0F1 ATP synthase subunit A [Microbulbifer marinus]SDZ80980.1 ATP synthase F0 subcomplex A subunit [Microbulbifer marinus]
MDGGELFPSALFRLGPLTVTSTVVTTWAIIAVIGLTCWLLSRQLQTRPGAVQTLAEGVVTAIEDAIGAVAPDHVKMLLPFIASLWIFLVIANLCGLIPGVHSPTRDLSATAALAILVFLSVHWFGIRSQGLRRYLHHYLTPTPLLLPFHLISEVTRTVALAVRLFGNIMSLEMAALLILLVAGFLAPIPILMLHIIEALVQAYIFGMLALIYVAGGLQSQMLRQQRKENSDAEGEQR